MPPYESIFSSVRNYGQSGTPQQWQNIERQALDPRFGGDARNALAQRERSYVDPLTGGYGYRSSSPLQSSRQDIRYSMPYQSPTSVAMPTSRPSTGGGSDYFSSLASGLAGLMPTGGQAVPGMGAQSSGLSGYASRYGPGGSEEIARQRGYGVGGQVSSGAMRGFNDANRMTQEDRDAVRQETQDFRERMRAKAQETKDRRMNRNRVGGAGAKYNAADWAPGGPNDPMRGARSNPNFPARPPATTGSQPTSSYAGGQSLGQFLGSGQFSGQNLGQFLGSYAPPPQTGGGLTGPTQTQKGRLSDRFGASGMEGGYSPRRRYGR